MYIFIQYIYILIYKSSLLFWIDVSLLCLVEGGADGWTAGIPHWLLWWLLEDIECGSGRPSRQQCHYCNRLKIQVAVINFKNSDDTDFGHWRSRRLSISRQKTSDFILAIWNSWWMTWLVLWISSRQRARDHTDSWSFCFLVKPSSNRSWPKSMRSRRNTNSMRLWGNCGRRPMVWYQKHPVHG